MIHLPKSQPAPVSLATEKTKASGRYNCEDVLLQIQTDFKNKCYICESKEPKAINVEHFVPHRGDIENLIGTIYSIAVVIVITPNLINLNMMIF